MTQFLNEKQKKAVEHVEGPLLVLAGAGSGKTRVVTERILFLLDMGILPSDLLAVTFSNKAAEEMRSRIRQKSPAAVLCSTFHSLGARILRESIQSLGYTNRFTIYDEDDSEKLLKNCLCSLQHSSDKGEIRSIRSQISSAKNNLLEPQDTEELRQIYQMYQERMRECDAVDFDDLLYLTAKLFQKFEDVKKFYQKKWLFILIDEYQDTNSAQYQIIKMLVEQHQNIFAVGDPDQSIYSWRGAQYENILNFEKDFPGAQVVTLDQNYRTTNQILQGANALIGHNQNRFDKQLWSALGEGEKIKVFACQNEREEAVFVSDQILQESLHHPLKNIAIFYRTNAQSRVFEDALLAKKVGYQIIGGLSFYQRKEIKDLLSYLKMLLSNTDLISFLRSISNPKRGLGQTTLEALSHESTEKGIPIFTLCEEILEHKRPFKLGAKQRAGLQEYVKTIHSLREKRALLSLHEQIHQTAVETGYFSFLEEDQETAQERKENIEELVAKAFEWEQETEGPSLVHFLEEISLKTQREEDPQIPRVQLMTVHHSKGLEFEVVFLVGLEEDLFPHINAKDNPTAIEEERRLCYVGMTRAKKKLYLCLSSYRYMWGGARFMRPSRFLKEIPSSFLSYLSSSYEEDPYLEHSEGFAPGDQIQHKEFGIGTVKKAYQGSFGLTYEVFFPSTNIARTLVAKYAKLQPHPN